MTGDDSTLLADCRKWHAVFDQINSRGACDDWTAAQVDRLGVMERRIAATPASTIAAIAAKLRVHLESMDDKPHSPDTLDVIQIRSARDDLERLAGRAWA